MTDLERLRAKEIRIISTKRKKYLRKHKKDINIWWSAELHSYVRTGL